MIPMNQLFIPSNNLRSSSCTKILCIQRRPITMSIDMLSSLLSKFYSVAQCFFELVSLGSIAGGMDRKSLDCGGGLGVGGCGWEREGYGGEVSGVEDGGGERGCCKCCGDEELRTHVFKSGEKEEALRVLRKELCLMTSFKRVAPALMLYMSTSFPGH